MKRAVLTCCIAAALLAAHGTAAAQDLGVSARIGTLGPSLELTHGILPQLNVRAGVSYLPYGREDILLEDVGDIDLYLDAHARLVTLQALLDFYPLRNALRVTGGLVYNGTNVKGKLRPAEAYMLEGHTFAPEKIGSLEATVAYGSKISPYLGLGIGGSARSRVGVTFDIGALYTNSPSVEMAGTGMIAPTAAQAPSIEAGLQSFKFYPVVSLGITLRVL
ncbi:MAG TPA: hypothetical protein VFG50_00075 [Rhodothermales bacterium]|nr:hypothetical protein [Rhodothermales bacterium]